MVQYVAAKEAVSRVQLRTIAARQDYRYINPLYADDHYRVIYQKLLFDGIAKFTSSSLTRLILRTVPHWIHLLLVLETIWSFLGHV